MTTVNKERQYELGAIAEMGIANIGAGNGVAFNLPYGAHLVDIGFHPSTAFDGTTNTVTASDGTTTFISAEDVKVTTAVAVDVKSKYFPTGGTITFTMAQTGAATVGKGYAWIKYLKLNRVNENQE